MRLIVLSRDEYADIVMIGEVELNLKKSGLNDQLVHDEWYPIYGEDMR